MDFKKNLSPVEELEKSGEYIPAAPPITSPKPRSSFLRWLLSPFIWAFLIIVVVFLVLMFGRQWYDSLLARFDQQKIVHFDNSIVKSGIRPQVQPTVTLVYQNQDGKRVRVIADAQAYSEFVNQQTVHLEQAREQLLTDTQVQLHRALNEVFQEMQQRVERFADWYFAYTTTYKLLWEATTSASGHLLSFSANNLTDAVAYDVEKYLHKHYENIVLRPEVTDPQLQAVYKNTLKFIHEHYLNVLSTMHAEFQAFVAKYTTHLEKPSTQNTQLVFDWQSQFNKINMAEYEKGPQGAAFGAALVAGGAATGKVVAGAVGSKAITGAASQGVLAKLSAPFVSKAVLVGAGGALGTLGGPLGTALGALGGLGIDYMLNEGMELTQRETFITDVTDALNTTQAQWEKEMQGSLNEVIDIWLEDTIQLLPRYQET